MFKYNRKVGNDVVNIYSRLITSSDLNYRWGLTWVKQSRCIYASVACIYITEIMVTNDLISCYSRLFWIGLSFLIVYCLINAQEKEISR